jgi:methylglutaconyl-CoA hydratase
MAEAATSSFLSVRREGDLLFVTLEDPRRANALSPPMVAALTELYRRPLRQEGVRAILLSGAGRHFSAGADLEHLAAQKESGLEAHRKESRALRDLFASILQQDALTVAMVHGACVAGGCGLATAHDFVVAADGSRFMYSEVKIGFVAALVATFLPLRVRGRDARQLLLHPRFLEAHEALDIGLVDRVVPEDELHQAAEALVVEILANASSESLARTKRLLLENHGRPLLEAMESAAEANAQSRLTEDCRRGVAHFLEHKQAPRWR